MEEPVTGYFDRVETQTLTGILLSGGIAVLPTDTMYGFHCISSCPSAIREIEKLKGGCGRRGFILLASGIGMVERFVPGWPRGVRDTLCGIWPAPLTAILPSGKDLDPLVSPGGGFAVRVPSSSLLRRLISSVDVPLVSTSVNRSGMRPLTRIREIRRMFPSLPAYISQRGRHGVTPSTIVDFTVRPFKLLRRGRYRWDE